MRVKHNQKRKKKSKRAKTSSLSKKKIGIQLKISKSWTDKTHQHFYLELEC
jgi:hypothetical protein